MSKTKKNKKRAKQGISGDQNNTFGGLLGGRPSYSGVNVTSLTSMEIGAFWAGVEILSQAGSRTKIELSKKQDDGRTEPVLDDPRYHLVAVKPHEGQTAGEFWAQFIVQLLIWRNAFAEIIRGPDGNPKELKPLLSRDTYPLNKVQGSFQSFDGLYYETVNAATGENRKIRPANMLHVRAMTYDGIHGMEIPRYVQDSVGAAVSRRKFASRFFANGGRPGGMLKIPKNWDKEDKKAIEQDWRRMYENNDALFKTLITRNIEGLEFEPVTGHTFVDTQILEGQEFDVREMARVLNVPPHMLGDMTAANYNSLEQQQAAFWSQSLSNWTSRIAEQCWLKLLTPSEHQANELTFTHKLSSLDYADSQVTADVASKLTVSGIMTQNESRALFDLPPIEGGDELLTPPGNTKGTENEQPADSSEQSEGPSD